jgi:hypothetical protein
VTTITVGSGLGGFTAIAPQPAYGGTFVTPTRPIYGLKSNKATHDPHIVDGGPYLEYGRIVQPGVAHVQTWQDAKGTLVCDAMSSGLALLLATAFGSPGQLTESSSLPAYQLGGSGGIRPEPPERNNSAPWIWSGSAEYPTVGEIVLEGTTWYESIKAMAGTVINKKPSTETTFWKVVAPYVATKSYTAGNVVTFTPSGGKAVAYVALTATKESEPPANPMEWQVLGAQSGCCFDMQLGVPTNSGEVTPWNYHSCVITKMELVFERTGLVACTFDWDAQYVENTTALIVPTTSLTAAPFSMANTLSVFKVGAPSAMVKMPGVKKLTVSIERKLAVDRIYLGNVHKEVPSTNGLLDLMVVAETDYTEQAKKLLETFLKNEPQELEVSAVGGAIGTSLKPNTLSMALSNGFIQTGGEAPLDGPDIVKNTVTLKGTINESNAAPLTGKLITADTTF